MQAYADYYMSQDLWLDAIQEKPEGEIVVGSKLVPDSVLERSEFYSDFLAREDLHYLMTPILQSSGPGSWTMPIFRPKRRGDFGADEIRLAKLIAPHFKRALQMQRVLAPAALAAQAHADALDRLRIGVALFNGRGQVIHLNRSAEAILEMADGLSLVARRLMASRRADSEAINRLLECTINTIKGGAPLAGGPLSIPRPSGRQPFGVMIAAIPRQQLSIGSHLPEHVVKAIAIISDPDKRSAAPLQSLQSLFGLTRSEAAVCRELINGSNVTEVADRLGVEPRTVRRHLEHIFEKTGTHRQATLVGLLLCSVAMYTSTGTTDAEGDPTPLPPFMA